VSYYTKLFTSTGPHSIDKCISVIGDRVSTEMNEKLIATFTTEEVKFALDQMGPLKAPGLDGFTVSFYQHNWHIVGSEVCKAVLYF
jgi:hypothetical protein